MNLTFVSIKSDMYFYGFYSIYVLFSVIISACQCQSTVNLRTNEVGYRLPNETSPESYEITIVTNIDKNNFTFSGTVVIHVRVLEVTSNITLHARQLTIESVKLESETRADVKLDLFVYDESTEFLTIPTVTQLEAGKLYTLTVKYTGELRTDYFGFYRSSYVNSSGHTRWLATTQFEPTDARHAFPCYDEPGIKSRFIIHIEHGEMYNAISNMKETRSKAIDGRVVTSFDETPLISPYLIAFIVSDYTFTRINATDENNTTQRVFANKESIDQTSYALIEGIHILKAMENTLQVPFSLPKLDHASITYTVVGAMENWGLITYPENRLLFDPTIHTEYRQMTVTVAMTHETSHQWFGNLVSPKWWSYLWLNEGFATLFKYFAADLIHPKWNIFHNFIVSEVQQALHIDAQSDSRPMTHYVESPEDIESIFDDITYSKAGSVIRMFMHALGEKTFMKGLHYYLTNNSYSTADEDTLFESLDSAVKEDNLNGSILPNELNIKDLFGSWSNQKGFPLLRVSRNYDDGSVVLYQHKYDAVFKPNESDSSTWWIPYNFASANNPEFNVTTPFGWLPQNHQQTVITPNQTDITWTNDDWLIFNRQQTGYYRVLYDEQNYNLLNTELNYGNLNKIHPINRAQILDDLQDFVNSGRVSPVILCNTLTYLKKESSHAPWETAKTIFTEWNHNLQVSYKLPNFRAFVSDLVKPLYDKWTLNENVGETVFDKISRNTAVNLACEFGVQKCLDDTYTKFTELIDGQKVAPNIRGLAILNGIRSASFDEITKKLWQIFLSTDHSDLREEIISSIGNIQNYTIMELFLNKSVEEFGVTSPERMLIVTTVIESGQKGVSLAIRFLSRELYKVNTTIGSVPTILTNVAERILAKDTETQFFDLLDVAKQNSVISEKEIVAIKRKAIERLRWQEHHLKSFESEFFTGKCTGNGVKLVTIPALVFILLCFSLRNQFY